MLPVAATMAKAVVGRKVDGVFLGGVGHGPSPDSFGRSLDRDGGKRVGRGRVEAAPLTLPSICPPLSAREGAK
jgi:hypothetical protein